MIHDKILFMHHGSVVEYAETSEFFTDPETREAERLIAGRYEDL